MLAIVYKGNNFYYFPLAVPSEQSVYIKGKDFSQTYFYDRPVGMLKNYDNYYTKLAAIHINPYPAE